MTLPFTETLLHRLGWDDGWEAAFAEQRAAGLSPARVAIQHRGAYDLIAETGEIRASATNRLVKSDELPAVGDWVGYDHESTLIESVLERRTAISRKEVWHAVREQVLAANVDVAFLVQALPLDFNPRRLERYLAMAWESGAQPIVLLTKTDLVDDVEPYLAEVELVTLGACPALAVSAKTGNGLDALRPWLEPNRTAVLLGSSGVGKSTIVNALAGEALLETQEVREDDQRGRHTTTHRELIVLAAGGVVLDTPGIRELQLWDADLEQTFGDVEEIARRCRFSDCSHDQRTGLRDPRRARRRLAHTGRWQSYVKLSASSTAIELRRNHLLRQEKLREYKIRARQNRTQEEALTPPRVREDAVEFALPDPEHVLQRVVLGQEVTRPRPGPPFEWRDGAWRLGFAAPRRRPPGVPARDRRDVRARSRQPAPRAQARSATSRSSSGPSTNRPTWLDSIADAGPVEPLEIRSRRLVARVHVLLYATPDPPGNDAPLARRPRRPRVRELRRTDALPRRDELGRADPPAAGGADPAGRPQRDLLGVRALRRCARA